MGSVVGLYLTEVAEGPMRAVPAVEVQAGRGIVGDRYTASRGTWSRGARDHRAKRHITFIEQEALDAVRRDHGVAVDASDTRRNVVTEGVALNHLVGREFQVAGVRFRGVGLCEPCAHLQRVSGKPLLRPLVHRGGLNAEVLTSGTVRIGDAIEVRPAVEPP